MDERLRLAVFISGSGTNLQALIDACARPDFPAQVVVVVSNNPEAHGLTRAAKASIPTVCVPHRGFKSRGEHEAEILRQIEPYSPRVIALAGYMRVVTPVLIDHFNDTARGLPGVVNIHPADTRAYQGAHGYEFALGLIEGAKRLAETWITVHFVDSGVDTGIIIAKAPVSVLPNDTLESLRERGLKVEHRLYPEVIRMLAEGRLQIRNGAVEILEPTQHPSGRNHGW